MAELASGAVRSLLGVLRNEAQLLGRVEGDVQFIREEMESMNSFLQHLARTTSQGREHDDQVRTWMKQVRDLAYDCSSCIDLYLLRGDPAVYRATGPVGRYVWWVPWYLHKLYGQHRAAIRLRELKDRARDVGKRRLRYDVKIPPMSGDKQTTTSLAPITGAASSSEAAGVGDTEEEEDDDPERSALAFSEPRILEDCTQELVSWLTSAADEFPSIAISAPDKEDGNDVANEALTHPSLKTKFDHKFGISFPGLLPASPLITLDAILRELEPESSKEDKRARVGELESKIVAIEEKIKQHLEAGTKRSRAVPLEPLDILHDTLQDKLGEDQIEKKIEETAKKIKEHMEVGLSEKISWIGLDHPEYLDILREHLPQTKRDRPVNELATDKLGDHQIARNVKKIWRELLPKPQQDKSVKEDADGLGEDQDQIEEKIKETTDNIVEKMLRKLLPKPKEDTDELSEDQMWNEKIEEITRKIKGTLENIRDRLLIKEITTKVKEHLKDKRIIIVLDGINYSYKWWETKRALNQLGCAAGSAVIVITKYTQGSEEFCHPTREAIIYSLVHFYYNKMLYFTSRRKNKDWSVQILREILQNCEHHEFCVKMFAHAMYVNPNKSKEELEKLRDTLDSSGPLDINAKKMLMFSYGDLPRDYKTCLLNLAIFPQGQKIRRSTLVGRWAAEGLITKDDWPSSVHRAERCFDELVNRWLVYPGDIGAAGKVKSCIVHDMVHKFITKIAKKERFVETRLSHQHARHFSVLSDVRLCSSDTIERFLQKLYIIPQLPLVKVLDLEGCKPFKMKQHYLENICNKMLLLKYLSLRNTDITKLPREINNLHQLEVLDIRQTHVDASATRYLMLPKLKRLLASCNIDTTTTRTDNINRTKKSFDAVELPRGIEKMTNMEVLSHVEASEGRADLKYIRKLWQLRKLGVVIDDSEAHLKKLVRVIGDLSETVQSLSISIRPLQASIHGTPSNTDISLKYPPKVLESLSIRGTATGQQLFLLLVKHCDQLAKVTLQNTYLNEDHMKYLGELPKLRYVRLQHESYTKSNLTFKKEVFQNLKYILVEGSNMTDISFEDEAAPELEKIVLSSANMNNISFGNGAAKLEKIDLSYVNITSITFRNGAAPKLEEIALSNTNITGITFEDGATPNMKKIVLSLTNVEFLSGINYLPVLMELELKGSGITSAALRSLFTDANQLAKVTLRDTLLKQCDLQILAKQPNMRRLMLLDESCDESELNFNKDEFQKLKLLVVECFCITKISFVEGAAPNLKKIVWSFTNIESLSGIGNLPKLKELEFNGDLVPYQARQAIKAHGNKLDIKHNKPQNGDQEKESADEAGDGGRFPFFWKKKKDRC